MKKATRRKKPGQRPFQLTEHKFPYTRIIEFPQVKGRTVEKIQFYSSNDERSITIIFQDRMALALNVVPGFQLEASFEDFRKDSVRVVKRWKGLSS